MTRTGWIAAVVAFVGLLAGLVGAAVIPRTTQGRQAAATTPFSRLPGPVTEQPRRDLEAGKSPEERGATLDVTRGSVVTELRRPDPAGGPAWVIRSFEASEVYARIPGLQRSGHRSLVRHCVQLGRELDGRFGWVDGDQVFRRVLTRDKSGTPTECGSRKLAARKELMLRLTTLIGHPTQDDRSILGSVVWGTSGKPLASLTLDAAGRTTRPEQGTEGAFLEFYGPDRSPADVSVTSRYADGIEKRRTLSPIDTSSMGGRMRARLFPKVRPETLQIVARTSSPSGGPSIGLTGVKSVEGAWCQAEQGTIVGNRVGSIDADAGTMWEQDPSQPMNCSDGTWPPGQAINLGSSYGADPNEGKLDPGRAALRLQSGLSTMQGFARDDVELITFASPRDVRTIAPTGPAHAFIVAWDGDFAASGRVVITTHLKDGTTRTMTEDLTW